MPNPATTPFPSSFLSYQGPPSWWTAACNSGFDMILAAHRQWSSLLTLQSAPLSAFWRAWGGAVAAATDATPIDTNVPMLPTPPIVEPLALMAAAVEAAPSPLEAAPPIEAAETSAANDQAEAPMEAVADELTRIVGIGPRLAAALAREGVTTFAEIAAWTADDLARFDKALDLKGRAVRDAWVAQAKRFAEAAGS
jgi:predicted flap endonuclease-1-like 5' DNA nuclease